jgi:hypothetical protein
VGVAVGVWVGVLVGVGVRVGVFVGRGVCVTVGVLVGVGSGVLHAARSSAISARPIACWVSLEHFILLTPFYTLKGLCHKRQQQAIRCLL